MHEQLRAQKLRNVETPDEKKQREAKEKAEFDALPLDVRQSLFKEQVQKESGRGGMSRSRLPKEKSESRKAVEDAMKRYLDDDTNPDLLEAYNVAIAKFLEKEWKEGRREEGRSFEAELEALNRGDTEAVPYWALTPDERIQRTADLKKRDENEKLRIRTEEEAKRTAEIQLRGRSATLNRLLGEKRAMEATLARDKTIGVERMSPEAREARRVADDILDGQLRRALAELQIVINAETVTVYCSRPEEIAGLDEYNLYERLKHMIPVRDILPDRDQRIRQYRERCGLEGVAQLELARGEPGVALEMLRSSPEQRGGVGVLEPKRGKPGKAYEILEQRGELEPTREEHGKAYEMEEAVALEAVAVEEEVAAKIDAALDAVGEIVNSSTDTDSTTIALCQLGSELEDKIHDLLRGDITDDEYAAKHGQIVAALINRIAQLRTSLDIEETGEEAWVIPTTMTEGLQQLTNLCADLGAKNSEMTKSNEELQHLAEQVKVSNASTFTRLCASDKEMSAPEMLRRINALSLLLGKDTEHVVRSERPNDLQEELIDLCNTFNETMALELETTGAQLRILAADHSIPAWKRYTSARALLLGTLAVAALGVAGGVAGGTGAGLSLSDDPSEIPLGGRLPATAGVVNTTLFSSGISSDLGNLERFPGTTDVMRTLSSEDELTPEQVLEEVGSMETLLDTQLEELDALDEQVSQKIGDLTTVLENSDITAEERVAVAEEMLLLQKNAASIRDARSKIEGMRAQFGVMGEQAKEHMRSWGHWLSSQLGFAPAISADVISTMRAAVPVILTGVMVISALGGVGGIGGGTIAAAAGGGGTVASTFAGEIQSLLQSREIWTLLQSGGASAMGGFARGVAEVAATL